jgi:hypothetical protein
VGGGGVPGWFIGRVDVRVEAALVARGCGIQHRQQQQGLTGASARLLCSVLQWPSRQRSGSSSKHWDDAGHSHAIDDLFTGIRTSHPTRSVSGGARSNTSACDTSQALPTPCPSTCGWDFQAPPSYAAHTPLVSLHANRHNHTRCTQMCWRSCTSSAALPGTASRAPALGALGCPALRGQRVGQLCQLLPRPGPVVA